MTPPNPLKRTRADQVSADTEALGRVRRSVLALGV